MNRTVKVFASALLLTALAGCSDATASLKDASTPVMKAGSKTITKGELYTIMNSYTGAAQIVQDATKVITSQEIEVTDEMREQAESTLSMYKMFYGESFQTYLDSTGIDEQTYVDDYLIPGLQAEKLNAKYVEENYDALCAEYMPVRATILEFEDADSMNAALSALKDGSASPAEAAAANGSTSTGEPEILTIDTTKYDALVLGVARSASPDDGWNQVAGDTGGKFSLIRVEPSDTEEYKNEVTEALGSLSDIDAEATSYFFKKYNFRVYDIDLYKALQADNPDVLVQEVPISAQ